MADTQRRRGEKTSPRMDPASLGNAPTTAYDRAKAEWAERMGSSVVERNRWALVAIFLSIALVMAMVGFNQLLPLKSVEPFIIEVDRFSGETNPSAMRAKSYVPQEREIRFFVARWVRQLLEINPGTADSLKTAYLHVRGTAVDEFKEFLQKTNVFAEIKGDPSLVRTVDISSINFIQQRVVLIRLVTNTRSTRSAPEQKRFIININFELNPPKEEASLLENPIGFYVTHFDFREELK